MVDELGEEECLRLISGAEVGRIAYRGRYGPSVLPVNYKLHDRTAVFRTAASGAMGEDLRTGIADAELRVAFEVDEIDMAAREGWNVLIQGPAHHVDDPAEQEAVLRSGVQPWPGGQRGHFIRITPRRITGRRIRHPGWPAHRRLVLLPAPPMSTANRRAPCGCQRRPSRGRTDACHRSSGKDSWTFRTGGGVKATSGCYRPPAAR